MPYSGPLTLRWQLVSIPLTVGVIVVGSIVYIAQRDGPGAPPPISYVENTTDQCTHELERWEWIQIRLNSIAGIRNLFYAMAIGDTEAKVPLSRLELPVEPIQLNNYTYTRYKQAVVFEDDFESMQAEADRRVNLFSGLMKTLRDPAEYERVQRTLDDFLAENPDPAWVERLDAIEEQASQEWWSYHNETY
jgi:hypothetical protein